MRRLGALVPLTRRGWAVLGTAVVAYAVGVLAGYPVFRALAGVALGALLAALLLTVARPRADVRRDVYPDRVERGRPALATLRVRNTGSRPQPALSARDIAGDAPHQVQIRVAVRRLAPGAEATYRYELPTTRRGLLRVGPLVLERGDPFGLARREVAAGDPTTLRVHPRRHKAVTATAGRPRHHHEGRSTDDSLHGSTDLRDVRPYVVGDEVRHLHWKATARTGQLMVRSFVDPDQPMLSLVLDTRSGAMPAEGFEEAVEVVASLAETAALSGHRCRLLTSDGVDLLPAVGPAGARELLDALTEVGQSRSGRFDVDQYAAGVPATPPELTLGRAGGGAIVLVSGAGLSVREPAQLLLRYRPVTVILIDPAAGTAGHGGTGGRGGNGAAGVPGAAGARAAGTPVQGVRWLVAPNAEAAVRLWNTEG